MKGSTKPSGMINVGATACFWFGVLEGGWYWLFLLGFIMAIVFDSYRVAIHEEEHRCG